MKIIQSCLLLVLLSCSQNAENLDNSENDAMKETDEIILEERQADTDTITFLALGDSYTIGESVAESERWPVVLAAKLNDNGIKVADPVIVARTGWTTNELQNAIKEADLEDHYDFVSLLIGVNNQYRGYSFDQYEKEFVELLDQAIAFSGDPKKTFVLSIPDYGVTPFGQTKDPEKIAKELDDYNAFAKSMAQGRGVEFIDITSISREAKDQPDLVAADGLHPSGEMYKRWVDLITPWAIDMLAK